MISPLADKVLVMLLPDDTRGAQPGKKIVIPEKLARYDKTGGAGEDVPTTVRKAQVINIGEEAAKQLNDVAVGDTILMHFASGELIDDLTRLISPSEVIASVEA